MMLNVSWTPRIPKTLTILAVLRTATGEPDLSAGIRRGRTVDWDPRSDAGVARWVLQTRSSG